MRATRPYHYLTIGIALILIGSEIDADDIDADAAAASKRYVLAATDASMQYRSEGFFAAIDLLTSQQKMRTSMLAQTPLDELLELYPLQSPFSGDPRFISNTSAMVERIEPFVWGGTNAQENEFPESVVTFGASRGVCSGVLITPNRVLTAGHCVCADRVDWVRFGQSVGDFNAEFAVRDYVLMAGNCASRMEGQDLALLTLVGESELPPAKIADFDAISRPQNGTVVGFGRADRGRPPEVKRYADIVIVSLRCEGRTSLGGQSTSDAERYGCIPGQDLVAGSPAWPADACGGDSGGPFYIDAGQSRRLIAITSRGIPTAEQPCGEGGVYTRLDGAAADWLIEQGVML